MIKKQLEALKSLMKEKKIDAYMIPTADFHESEYVGEYFKCRAYITGFTGSAGTAVITQNEAALWTDGRYFVQAAAELKDSGIKLMKMGVAGVPTIDEYLVNTLPENGVLGFDGRVVNSQFGEKLKTKLQDKKISFKVDEDLAGEVWENRPELSKEPVWILEEKYAGKSAADKIKDLRKVMQEKQAQAHVITTLDDIVWLLNIRGNDVLHNPVVLSYMVVFMDRIDLYINKETVNNDVEQYLASLGVNLKEYNQIYSDLKTWTGQKVLLEKGKTNCLICTALEGKNEIIHQMNPASVMKAVKNETEIENMKKAHIKDGVAMTRFIYWLKKNIGKIDMDEVSVSDYLEELRKEQDGYLDLSFDTISAYGANAAMCHYHAHKETCARLEAKGLYLVDSGGQYLEGTTDITRTIALGALTAEEKKHFTLVSMSMLRLGDAKFMYGCRGVNLDYIARELLWRNGLNFDHGTGHGIGYLLNVHERPNGIRWKIVPERQDSCIIEPGMITSDEPGLYIEGKHGIRTENLILCKKDEKNEYGQFLRFEYLTFVPIDLDALDFSVMEERDKKLLNEYHKDVYEKISPYLNEDERTWLKEYTREI